MTDDAKDRTPDAANAEAPANFKGLLPIPIWAAIIIAFGTICSGIIISGLLPFVFSAVDLREEIRINVNPVGWTLDVRNDGTGGGTIEASAGIVYSDSTGPQEIDVDIYPTGDQTMTFGPGNSGRLHIRYMGITGQKPELPSDATACALKYRVQSGSDTNKHQDAFECPR
ncbi:MAG: hypothetical protein F4213_09000 [Boseongicola sp. SB0677_bin_26]|nr:hypothetical protein [Boseongicola sp. SB0665_bin_10]MYG26148.1 hypothetical protein [Boseongicola sp. SB0677_bin_26]